MNNHKQTRQMPSKIGLFGGTFNPVHRGHLKVADDVLQQFHLDTIHFIPCALPPHKTDTPLADARHRLEMVRLGVAQAHRFAVSDVEVQRQGPSYTWDTLQYYKNSLPDDVRLYFLVGLDAFFEIHSWKAFSRLFDEVRFVVMNRPGTTTAGVTSLQTICAYAQQHISEGYQIDRAQNMLRHAEKQPIHLASVTPVEIASSQIRQMIQNRESIEPWVPLSVARYIEEKGLYR